MIGTSTNGAAHTSVNGSANRERRQQSDQQTGAATAPAHADSGACGANGTPPAQPDGGRDARGRFVRGNAGGPGNPFARRVAQLRRTLCATVTEEDIEAVARALIERAKQGDVAAARVLLSYTIGQPAPAVDPDTLDLAEWDIYRQTPANVQDLEQFVTGVPAALACQLAGVLTPYLHARAASAIRAELTTDVGAAPSPKDGGAPSTNGGNGRRARRTPAAARPRPRKPGRRTAGASCAGARGRAAAKSGRQRSGDGRGKPQSPRPARGSDCDSSPHHAPQRLGGESCG